MERESHFEITFDRAAAAAGRVDVWRVHLPNGVAHVRKITCHVLTTTLFDTKLEPAGRVIGTGVHFLIVDGWLHVYGRQNGAK